MSLAQDRLMQFATDISNLAGELAGARSELLTQEQSIAARNTVIAAQLQQIADRDITIAGRNATIAERDATVASQEHALAARSAEMGLLGVVSAPIVGAYVGGGFLNPAGNMANYEAWLGRPAGMWVDFIGDTTWASFDSAVGACKAQWEPLRAAGKTLTLAVPLLTKESGGNGQGTYATTAQWAALASGGHNAHFTKLANDLIAAGYDGSNLVLRPGHEANGNWYAWAAKNHTADYIAGFKVAVDTIRAAYNAAGRQAPKISFCVALGPGDFDWNLIWPGIGWVDYLGMDVYNWTWNASAQATPQLRWNELVNQAGGLGKHVSRAAIWGVPCVVDEWGTGPGGGAGGAGVVNGGDDPYFLDQMWKWMVTHNYLYHCYWNHTAAFDGILSTGTHPLAAARYKLHWGD